MKKLTQVAESCIVIGHARMFGMLNATSHVMTKLCHQSPFYEEELLVWFGHNSDITLLKWQISSQSKPLKTILVLHFQQFCLKQNTSHNLSLTLLHSERPKLYAILAFLSAIGLT